MRHKSVVEIIERFSFCGIVRNNETGLAMLLCNGFRTERPSVARVGTGQATLLSVNLPPARIDCFSFETTCIHREVKWEGYEYTWGTKERFFKFLHQKINPGLLSGLPGFQRVPDLSLRAEYKGDEEPYGGEPQIRDG